MKTTPQPGVGVIEIGTWRRTRDWLEQWTGTEWKRVFRTPEAEGPCPTCSPPTRTTVNMVCQTCGADYS